VGGLLYLIIFSVFSKDILPNRMFQHFHQILNHDNKIIIFITSSVSIRNDIKKNNYVQLSLDLKYIFDFYVLFDLQKKEKFGPVQQKERTNEKKCELITRWYSCTFFAAFAYRIQLNLQDVVFVSLF